MFDSFFVEVYHWLLMLGLLSKDLLRATEELANEKQMLIERHDEEKSRLENAAHHLEDAVEQVTRATEEKETAYLAQIDDLNTQVGIVPFIEVQFVICCYFSLSLALF